MAEEKLRVQILSEREVATYTAAGEAVTTVALTFTHGDLPPMTVWIPKTQDTPELRAALIRARIQARAVGKPMVLEV